MKKIFSFASILMVNILFSQIQAPVFNLDFEKHSKKDELPNDWIKWGDSELKTDSTNAISGKNCLFINVKEGESFGSVAYKLPSNFKGKKITLEGFMKYEKWFFTFWIRKRKRCRCCNFNRNFRRF